jgi:hypothetical protein
VGNQYPQEATTAIGTLKKVGIMPEKKKNNKTKEKNQKNDRRRLYNPFGLSCYFNFCGPSNVWQATLMKKEVKNCYHSMILIHRNSA